jgi:hypothetical protein
VLKGPVYRELLLLPKGGFRFKAGKYTGVRHGILQASLIGFASLVEGLRNDACLPRVGHDDGIFAGGRR